MYPKLKLKIIAVFLLQVFIASVCISQKLPNKQTISLNAPTDIKIDGKAIEWNNKFQAYNTATGIFYTICNDDNYLYLTLQVTDPLVINKLYSNGLNFSITPFGKKDEKEGVSTTFPLFDKDDRFHVNIGNMPAIKPGSERSVMQADSFLRETNDRMIKKSKWIVVKGVKNMDTLISVYNDDGIKAAALFDNKMAYTWELAIALKYVNGISTYPKFNYHIKLNPIKTSDNTTTTYKPAPDGRTIPVVTFNVDADVRNLLNMMSPTDFWGEYTLFKKP